MPTEYFEIATPAQEEHIRQTVHRLNDLRASAAAAGDTQAVQTLSSAAGLLMFLYGATRGLESRLGRRDHETS